MKKYAIYIFISIVLSMSDSGVASEKNGPTPQQILSHLCHLSLVNQQKFQDNLHRALENDSPNGVLFHMRPSLWSYLSWNGTPITLAQYMTAIADAREKVTNLEVPITEEYARVIKTQLTQIFSDPNNLNPMGLLFLKYYEGLDFVYENHLPRSGASILSDINKVVEVLDVVLDVCELINKAKS